MNQLVYITPGQLLLPKRETCARLIVLDCANFAEKTTYAYLSYLTPQVFALLLPLPLPSPRTCVFPMDLELQQRANTTFCAEQSRVSSYDPQRLTTFTCRPRIVSFCTCCEQEHSHLSQDFYAVNLSPRVTLSTCGIYCKIPRLHGTVCRRTGQ